jgi:hypothetical protein
MKLKKIKNKMHKTSSSTDRHASNKRTETPELIAN